MCLDDGDDVTTGETEETSKAPELPHKTDDLFTHPEVTYTDMPDDNNAAPGEPELQEKLDNIDDYMRWNVWVCFYSCGLMALFSNYFVFSWLMSLCGIYKSFKCRGAKNREHVGSSRLYSCEARLLFYISIFVGLAVLMATVLKIFIRWLDV